MTNRGHLFINVYLHAKLDVQATFTSSDIVLQDFQTWHLLTFDLHVKQ